VGFYNCERLHSVLGNLPPSVFERNMAAKKLLLCPKLLDHYTPHSK
jgi:putative transposase